MHIVKHTNKQPMKDKRAREETAEFSFLSTSKIDSRRKTRGLAKTPRTFNSRLK